MNQRLFLLSYQDSNLDRQNQKLQCYHYTIRQSLLPKTSVLKRCKGTHNFQTVQIFLQLFSKYFSTLRLARSNFSYLFAQVYICH